MILHPREGQVQSWKWAAWAPEFPSDRPYLGLHQPAGDGGFPIVAWPELQGHGAGANIGNAQIGGGPWQFWKRKTGWERWWPEKDILLHGTGLSGHRGCCVTLFLETWPHPANTVLVSVPTARSIPPRGLRQA